MGVGKVMGLTSRQKLYGLNEYYFVINIHSLQVKGIITKDEYENIDLRELVRKGFLVEKADLEKLSEDGYNILKENGFMNEGGKNE